MACGRVCIITSPISPTACRPLLPLALVIRPIAVRELQCWAHQVGFGTGAPSGSSAKWLPCDSQAIREHVLLNLHSQGGGPSLQRKRWRPRV